MADEGKLRVVIVDDEPLARAVVREYLAPHEDVEIAAECGNRRSANGQRLLIGGYERRQESVCFRIGQQPNYTNHLGALRRVSIGYRLGQ